MDDGMPRVSEDTGEVMLSLTVSFMKVVPQSLVVMTRLTITEHHLASHADGAAAVALGN